MYDTRAITGKNVNEETKQAIKQRSLVSMSVITAEGRRTLVPGASSRAWMKRETGSDTERQEVM